MAQYHIGMPIQTALQLMAQGSNMYLPDVEYHRARAVQLQAKGAKHYSVCPQVTKEGLCGCTPPPQRPNITTYAKPYTRAN